MGVSTTQDKSVPLLITVTELALSIMFLSRDDFCDISNGRGERNDRNGEAGEAVVAEEVENDEEEDDDDDEEVEEDGVDENDEDGEDDDEDAEYDNGKGEFVVLVNREHAHPKSI